jgi:hypothetical protein
VRSREAVGRSGPAAATRSRSTKGFDKWHVTTR